MGPVPTSLFAVRHDFARLNLTDWASAPEEYRVAARLGSGALRADSILTAVAAILAVISLASVAASQALGLWWADAIAALIVGVIVLREGWSSLNLATRSRFGH